MLTMPSSPLRPCSLVLVMLVVLTLATYTVAEWGLADDGLTLLVLLFALLKAQLVADRFMGLRKVAGFWRPLLLVYLILLGSGIGLAFVLV